METSTQSTIEPAIFESVTGIVAGFSTRLGGTSEPPYDSLNLGLSTGDEDASVRENRRRLFEPLGFAPDRIAVAGQVHGAEVKEVTGPGLFPGFDGLVTQKPGILLCISAADCAAVLLADPEAHVIGACHSGWRGTAARISARTIHEMTRLGARPERVLAYVSPCISADRFEVGPEVAAQFDDRFVVQRSGAPRPFVDLKAAIRAQLVEEGVTPGHIEVSPHCTFSQTSTFFSYRAESGTTGRMMGFIGMR
ncbi:MAG TPA: peptidoglycan editing factor PgeF [Rhodothermales bacterium]|nr:peptidoglycan editing factor PgeF [Rhodothermales bacterium]